MTDEKIYDEPSKVTAEAGVVKVKGPNAVDVRMTPEAADKTSERLLFGAMQAMGDKIPVAKGKDEDSDKPVAAD